MNVTDGAVGLAAVLFDMDGLLVDTEPLWFEAETEVMERLGGPWTKQDQAALLGGSMERSVGYLLARATRPAPPATVERWLVEGMLSRTKAGRVTVLPGAAELLAEVAAAGLPYALVTGSLRPFVEAVLAATGFRFPVTVCGDDVPVTKPDPAPYLLAAKLLDVEAGPLRGPGGLAERRCLRHRGRLPGGRRAVVRRGSCRPRRLVVRSLTDVTLGTLRALASANA